MILLSIFSCLLFLDNAFGFDHTIVVPKAFRVGAKERVVLNLHGYDRGTVSAYLQDLPNKETLFSQIDDVELDADSAKEPVELEMMVSANDIEEFRQRQKVALVIEVTASNSDFTKTLEVLVSGDSGYLFVITDRPIYKPGDTALIRVFPLDQSMRQDVETIVTIIVKTPDIGPVKGVGVSKKNKVLFRDDNFIEDFYEIPEDPELGIWTIIVQYSSNGFETTSETSFDVKLYVLPTFQVTIEMNKPFVLLRDDNIEGTIKAAYSYGEAVTGNYYMAMKLKKTPDSIPTEIYKIPRDFFLTAHFRGGVQAFRVPVMDVINNLDEGEDISTLAANKATVFVEATVSGSASGVLESAMSSEIPFVKSPYRISTERTSIYYTPSLAYKLRIDVVESVGGRPARNVRTSISIAGIDEDEITLSNDRGQIDFQLDFRGKNPQIIRIKTQDPNVDEVDQATAELQILPYSSQNSRYLQISADNNVYRVGNRNTIQLTISYNGETPEEIRYYVLARGSIVHSGVNTPRRGNAESTERIPITQKMVPSARVVAYYLSNDEVVSNSFWFDVEDQCQRDLTISVPEEVFPGQRIIVGIEGAPNSLVSISGVDRASYFLYDKSRLTRQKMFDKMESYDQGCVRNGGGDGSGVFLEAGLTLSSKSNRQPIVDTLECNANEAGKRKKRQVEGSETVALIQQRNYINAMLKKCEESANSPKKIDSDTCEVRAARVRDNVNDFVPGCSRVFEEACLRAEKLRRRYRHRRAGRSNNNPGDVARSVATLRTNFQESLVFTNIRLDDQGRGSSRQNARDSITTFEFDAVSMQDDEDGFCVAETTNMRTFKDVFIQLYTPYSLKKLEQANLRISVFNYKEDEGVQVEIEVQPEDDGILCTHFTPGDWSPLIEFGVESTSARSTTLTVLPLKLPENGKTLLSLRLIRTDTKETLDQIRKEILIEESGEVKDTYQSYVIDLKNDFRQGFDIEFDFPESFIQESRKCTLYAYANFLGPSIEIDPITQKPNNIEGIFRMPYGCGEQNMLVCGPNVYAHMYLESVGTMEQGTPAFEASVARIESGYARELGFRSDAVQKKAFAVWHTYPPSTWLNAFVDKVFTKAKEYDTDLNIGPICDSLQWLLTQQVDGTYFDEKRPPFHREMHGAVGGRLTLTAYVVISLLETQSRCLPELNLQIQTAATNAVAYLRANKDDETFIMRPYALALLSYTFALHDPNSPVARELFGRLLSTAMVEDGKMHWVGRPASDIAGTDLHAYWYNQKPQAVSIEATAYALLAQIAMVRFENPTSQTAIDRARQIAIWLICQRNEGGAFISTQDTVIGLQALATYQMWIAGIDDGPTETNFNLQFTAPGTVWSDPGEQIDLTDENIGLRTEVVVPYDVISKTKRVSVTALGTGEGVLSYRCLYRTVKDEDACHFEIDYDIAITNENEVRNDNDPLKIKITLTISKPRGGATEMTIVEVGLLSGFVPIDQSIAQWAIPNVVDGLVDRYDITNVNVILYLRKIDANPLVINFDMEQNVPVSRPEPAKINVYDYYEPSIRCGTFYTLPQNTPDIRTANCRKIQNNEGEILDPEEEEANRREAALCKCAEGGCLKCIPRQDQLDKRVCLSGDEDEDCAICNPGENCANPFEESCQRNYAYLVNITSVSKPLNGDIFYKFDGDVIQVIKLGDDADVANSMRAEFIVRRDCYEACVDEALQDDDRDGSDPVYTLLPNTVVYILGQRPDPFFDRNGDRKHEYRLDDNAQVERYIEPEKCADARHKYFNHRFNCDGPLTRHRRPKPRTPKQQTRCDKWEKQMIACDNFDEMVRQIKEGCD